MLLGVGKITDPRLSQALLNFMQEGIRYAFEGDLKEDDDLLLGTRLPFLLILTKYGSWIKKNKVHRDILGNVLFAKEAALRSHPDFDEVHEDDLSCIREFQSALGLSSPKKHRSERRSYQAEESSTFKAPRTSTSPSSTLRSAGTRRPMSATGSQRSRPSVQSNLSPLVESPESQEMKLENESPSPQKRRRLTNSLPELHERVFHPEDSDSDSTDF